MNNKHNAGGIISSPNDIDLSRHGIIEAHAGTGKTYTIVKLVLRMLEQKLGVGTENERFVHLRDILLVTYTEKAAGELKKRIQEGIIPKIKELRGGIRVDNSILGNENINASKKNEILAAHLENCLNNMHEALTGTIHSVCLRLLQTHPFETGILFSTHIANDNEGAEALLRESMRTDWQDEATGLPKALRALERQGVKLEGKHLRLIRKTALELLRGGGRAIDTSLCSDTSGDTPVDELIDVLADKVENVNTGIKEAESELGGLLRDYCGWLSKLYSSGKLESKRLDAIAKLVSSFEAMVNTGVYDAARLSKPQKIGNLAIYDAAAKKKIPEYAPDIDRLANEISNHQYITLTNGLSALKSQLLYALICRAAEILAKRYGGHKRQNGLVSYDDMLRLMHDAVHGEKSVMLGKLRERLQYGIIDEFQDTSVIQWSIFKKIFLDDDAAAAPQTSAKIYVVGDPKQSIYSFQNADINSYISAKNTIAERGGATYSLVDNYRSLPEMISGYNAILCNGGEDWFLFDDDGGGKISYPSTGEGGECARAPKREAPTYPLNHKAVQIVNMDNDDAGEQRADAPSTSGENSASADESDDGNQLPMVAAACAAIKRLRGKTVSVPDGQNWKELTLDYSDFAVIVETHKLADPFIEEFRKSYIPCMKYKLRGVFGSPVARDLQALLTAIVKRGDRAPRTAALLTHFFNKPAEKIDVNRDLRACHNPYCRGDNLCIVHAIEHWGELADRQLWGRLFESITERTGIRQRLVRLIDGERKLADLRQVVDYCVEYLYRQNSSLKELADHLKRLYDEEEEAEEDRNIHTLSTEKSSVKILTMHAAKGLEFPVVFIVNRESKKQLKGPDILPWTDNSGKRRFTPYITIAQKTRERERLTEPQIESYKQDCCRERRRLLYVAMTRPQAMLFVPMYENEAELSPRLKELLEKGHGDVELFDEGRFGVDSCHQHSNIADDSRSIQFDDIPKLSLKNFVGKETSYTQLKRQSDIGIDVDIDIGKAGASPASTICGKNAICVGATLAVARPDADSDVDHSVITVDDGYNDIELDDEYHDEDVEVDDDDEVGISPIQSPGALPGGRLTGDALHKVIEEVLLKGKDINDINDIISDDVVLDNIVTKYLRRAGILNYPSIKNNPEEAVRSASSMIRSALTVPYPLGDGGTVTISGLPKSDRVTEMEFLFPAGRDRVRGFMDIVFRVKNGGHPAHPYRYHIIDWKSDTLENYGEKSVRDHYYQQKYQLQARIYAIALDKYLRGILGERYSIDENLGESLHVFIRGQKSFHAEKLKKLASGDGLIYITD